MINTIRIYFLKRKAKAIKIEMSIYENNYSCGLKMLKVICPEYSCLDREFNDIINKLKSIDKNFPKGK
jgi:hypothetical protein